MVYYGMEERLLLDADKAEAEHAVFQKRIDRLKTAFAGSKLSIARIVFSVLPLFTVILPLGKIAFQAPYISESSTINAIALYNMISKADFGALISLLSSPVLGKTFILFVLSLVTLVLSLLMVLVRLVLLMLSASPKGRQRNYTFNCFALLFAAASAVTFTLFAGNASAIFPSVISGSVGFGAYIYFALLAASFAIDVMVFQKRIEVVYKDTFVGGIPSAEYFQLVESGVPLADIRKEMEKRTAEREEAERLAAEQAALQEQQEQAAVTV